MKKLLILLFFTACTKEYTSPVPQCQRVYYLSDKYTFDTVYLKTDTLWPWGRYNNVFCGKDTLIFSNYRDSFRVCGIQIYEVLRCVIGDKITYPKIYK